MKELEQYRDADGCINFDKIENVDSQVLQNGNAPKFWLTPVWAESFTILFKQAFRSPNLDWPKNVSVVPYEVYSALVGAEIAKQLGIPTAEYDLAKYRGKYGVITYNFLKSNESLITGYELLGFVNEIDKSKLKKIERTYFDEKHIFGNILESLKLYLGDDAKAEKIFNEWILNIYMPDFLGTELDRHPKNWGLKYDGKNYSLAPRFDSDSIANAYLGPEKVSEYLYLVKKIGEADAIEFFFSNTKLSVFYEDKLRPMKEDFELFCRDNPLMARMSFEIIGKLDMVEVFKNVEKKIKTKLPIEYKNWVGLVTNYQIKFIKEIIDSLNEELDKGCIL